MPKKKKINKKDQNSKKRKRASNFTMKKEKKKVVLPGSLQTPGACNVMKEEEEYDLHHENKMTSEDFEDFEDTSHNSSEIRDPVPTKEKKWW